eukprot:NODE_7391_length_443_cov_200.255155.p2 GENE.NODE_7391_length_443_cov_200.255155~~NODE_7391_length_443_cov_200.255155.p2  ORF type:complete len:65 (+),score=13.60 NODE_7391_length_443_cov_200.255155:135-329(+)
MLCTSYGVSGSAKKKNGLLRKPQVAVVSSSAVPRFVQKEGSLGPDFKSTHIMKEGRSRVPVLTG